MERQEEKLSKEIIGNLETIESDYYGSEFYDSQELDALKQVIINKSPFRYYGKNLTFQSEKLERRIKELFDIQYVHTVNSCTGALLSALHALNIGIGDEVIIPGYFWVAMANTVILRGAFPVLCEIDDTYNIDYQDLEGKINENTKCIIVAHMDGVPVNILPIIEIANKHNIKIIEDFSQCMGGKINGKFVGTFGDIGVASLQVNKLLTAGEGGIIVTDNKEYYLKMVSRSDFGYQREERDIATVQDLRYVTIGEGRRNNEMCAAVMNIQLDRLSKIIDILKNNKLYLKNYLGDITPIIYRDVAEGVEEICTSMFLQFPDEEMVDFFINQYFHFNVMRNLNIYKLSEFGCHIYYNCIGLVNKCY